MSTSVQPPVYMSVTEYLAWDPGDDVRYELVDGEPRAMAPANITHGILQSELCRLLGTHLRERHSACVAVANPGVIPRLLSSHNVRVPDVGVTCTPQRRGAATMTDPILLAEILSPSNQAKTWSNVWAYTSIPSMQEIVVLYTSRICAKLLRRDPEGNWPDEPTTCDDGDLELSSIAYRLPLLELYARAGLP